MSSNCDIRKLCPFHVKVILQWKLTDRLTFHNKFQLWNVLLFGDEKKKKKRRNGMASTYTETTGRFTFVEATTKALVLLLRMCIGVKCIFLSKKSGSLSMESKKSLFDICFVEICYAICVTQPSSIFHKKYRIIFIPEELLESSHKPFFFSNFHEN